MIMKYFEFSVIEGVYILNLHDLQILVCKLRDVNVIILESLQVGAIISNLSPTWHDYMKKLLYTAEYFTFEYIKKH